MNEQELQNQWQKDCNAFLKGKTIKQTFYLPKKNADEMGWFSRPLVILFTDGSYMYAMSDDEGNDGGAMFTSSKDLPVIPVLRD
jgi:hypothetical protein